MRVLTLALKDLLEIVRDRKSLLFLVVMPILFTLFFGFAFRFADPDPRLPVAVVDEDGGTLAQGLNRLLANSDTVRLEPLDADEVEDVDRMVADGRLAAAVLIPAGFSEGTLAGETVTLTLIAAPSPAGNSAGTAIKAAGKRLLGSLESGRLALQVAEREMPRVDAGARDAFLQQSLTRATEAWQQPDLTVTLEPVAVATAEPDIPQGFQQSSPGMLVMFSVFSLLTSAMVLAVERKAGTLQRMLTAPVNRATIIGGHLLAMFVLVFAQGLLLMLLGQIGFGVNYLHAPVATLLMMAVFALWAASVGLLIGAIVRSEEQVVMYALIAMFLFSALGGAWFPLAIAGETFSRIGHLLPTAWAMDGFQNIILRGEGFGGVLQPVAVVGAYAVLFFALAVWRFRFE